VIPKQLIGPTKLRDSIITKVPTTI